VNVNVNAPEPAPEARARPFGTLERARSRENGIALLALLLAAWSPFLREHPAVKEGNERLIEGDEAAALERYDSAEREVGPKPELEYDRGNALFSAGRHAEAAERWNRAVENAEPRLASRALQNAGNALDAQGDRSGAIAASAEALARDPSNDDARYNLEVLLRRQQEEERPQAGPKKDESGGAGGGAPPPSAGAPSPGDEGPKPDRGDPSGDDPQAQAPKPEPRPDGEPRDEQRRPEGERDRESEARPSGTDPGAESAREDETQGRDALERHEAEALLDALRARERNMPMASPRERRTRRTDAERDW
jgi:Ca-activated chloride channel family protein